MNAFPDNLRDRQEPGLYSGWWYQPDLGRHPYYNLRLAVGGDGVIEGTFLDLIGPGTLRGGHEGGFVWLTRRAGGFNTYYLGRLHGHAMGGAWIIGVGDWLDRNLPHRSYGLWGLRPHGARPHAGPVGPAPESAPLPSRLAMMIDKFEALPRHYEPMRQAIEACAAPGDRQLLERQYRHMRRLHDLALEVQGADSDWVDPDPRRRRRVKRFLAALGPRLDILLDCLGPDAVKQYARVFP